MKNAHLFVHASALCLLSVIGAFPVTADPIADFYKGKQIRHVIGSGTGGAYDQYSRMIAQHIGNHIPGRPTLVAQNMPGGGSRKAANWLYNVAAKDGTALGTVSQNIPVDQALDESGTDFDARRFNWIGSPFSSNHILILWHLSGIKTVEDAMAKEATVGGSGGNSPSVLVPKLANIYAGTKFKVITGYPGGSAVTLAMERGEVDGRGALSWQSLKNQNPDWVRDKKVHIILQAGIKKEADLPHVPLLSDLAKDADGRRILTFLSSPVAIGRPILTTPGVPTERVAALRRAFDLTMRDPKFIAEAKKRNMDLNPVSGEELQALVGEIAGISPSLIKKIKTEVGITGAGD